MKRPGLAFCTFIVCLALSAAACAAGFKINLEQGKPISSSYKTGWKLIDDQPGADATYCVATTKEQAKLELGFEVPEAATYTISARVGTSGSLLVLSVDGVDFQVSPPPQKTHNWRLLQVGEVSLSKGSHTLDLTLVSDSDTGLKGVPLDVVYVDYVQFTPQEIPAVPLLVSYAQDLTCNGHNLRAGQVASSRMVNFAATLHNLGRTSAEGWRSRLVLGYPDGRFYTLGEVEGPFTLAAGASYSFHRQWLAAPGSYRLYVAIFNPQGNLVHRASVSFDVISTGRQTLGYLLILLALTGLVALGFGYFNWRRLRTTGHR